MVDGYPEGFDPDEAMAVIFRAINALFPETWAVGDASKIAVAALRKEANRLDPEDSVGELL
jgi:hypothetical protein